MEYMNLGRGLLNSQSIVDFLLSPIGIVIDVFVVLVVAIFVFLYIRVKTKKSRHMKTIYNLEKYFVEIQTMPIPSKLVKIEQIGAKNVIFERMHQEYSILYSQAKKDYEEDLKAEFKVAKEQVQAGDYKNLAETMKGLNIKLHAYKIKMEEIDGLVSDVTKDETFVKEKEEKLRKIYLECREIYSLNESELDLFSSEFGYIFEEIDNQFAIYSEHLIRGHYTDAKEVLIMIERRTTDLHKTLVNAPKYANLAIKVIPEKINNIIDEYLDMQAQGYPLYHILVNSLISGMKDSLGQIIYSIRNFNFDGIEHNINDIMARINDLRDRLAKEKENRQQFDFESKDIYNKAEDLERLYIKYMKDITVLSRVYEIGENVKSLSETTKIEVNKLSVIRRTLDSLTYGKQPYSMRIQKLNELKAQVKIVEDAILNYRTSFEGMRDDSNLAYDLVTDATVKLKNLQLAVRNTKIEKLKTNFIEDFNMGYNLIDKLGILISHQPIDISKVNRYNAELKDLVVRIEKEANDAIRKAEYTEKLIMFANTYRTQFADIARCASKAELYFYDAKFDEAIELVKESLKRYVDVTNFEKEHKDLEESFV